MKRFETSEKVNNKTFADDFEEMEALLMEQERLADNLEKERQEKVELERQKEEQDKQQQEMKNTIKSLEEEIINVSEVELFLLGLSRIFKSVLY